MNRKAELFAFWFIIITIYITFVSIVSYGTYDEMVVNPKSGWLLAFSICYVILWTIIAFVGSVLGVVGFVPLRDAFYRTIVTIKPDGEQANPHCHVQVGPFNRRGRILADV